MPIVISGILLIVEGEPIDSNSNIYIYLSWVNILNGVCENAKIILLIAIYLWVVSKSDGRVSSEKES